MGGNAQYLEKEKNRFRWKMMSVSHVKEELSIRQPDGDEQEAGGRQVRLQNKSDYRSQFGSIRYQKPKAFLKVLISLGCIPEQGALGVGL